MTARCPRASGENESQEALSRIISILHESMFNGHAEAPGQEAIESVRSEEWKLE